MIHSSETTKQEVAALFGKGEDAKLSQNYPRAMMISPRIDMNPEEVDHPILWQGVNSNQPHPRKHTDNITISQLKPWMRITIPVKVVSLGVPSRANNHQRE